MKGGKGGKGGKGVVRRCGSLESVMWGAGEGWEMGKVGKGWLEMWGLRGT